MIDTYELTLWVRANRQTKKNIDLRANLSAHSAECLVYMEVI